MNFNIFQVYVHPGETALVFYTAKNPTDKPIIGISSYQLSPFEAAYYFNKIQCFCFEEQILSPGEQVGKFSIFKKSKSKKVIEFKNLKLYNFMR